MAGAVERLLASEVEWKEKAVEGVVEKVFEGQKWTQEKVALALMIERQRPVRSPVLEKLSSTEAGQNLDWKSLLSPTFKHTPLLSSSNLVALGRVLKVSRVSAHLMQLIQLAGRRLTAMTTRKA